METLRSAFQVPVGLSDHSEGIHVPAAAAALGACVIEKHFTVDRSLPGPDHPFALNPKELKDMVRAIRDVEAALGTGRKHRVAAEEELYRLARRRIFALQDIQPGAVISKEMVAMLRGTDGLEPKNLPAIIGRKARRLIRGHTAITWDDV
jgi:N-acetylneuraminate synthase/N,N'-diacetyllegionaminate synthase